MNPIIEVRQAWKAFAGAQALCGAEFTLAPASIHGLVGENGAGKSTLIKALTGVHQLDGGQILLDGTPQSFGTVYEAMKAGLSTVYQERNLVPTLSVAENILLHDTPRRRGALDYREMYRLAQTWLARVGLDISPQLPASNLSAAQSQLVEIARALAVNARVLLLDEPTASISGREADRLFEILADLRSSGTAVVFVSHHLEEILGLCDRVTVLRDGNTVLHNVQSSALDRTSLITAMVGRSVTLGEARASQVNTLAEPTLELRGVSTRHGHKDINFAVHPGEILGLYGLVGAGRTELALALLGQEKITSGEVWLGGKPVRITSPQDALVRHGIGYVSEDRKRIGTIAEQSVQHNVGVTVWDRIGTRFGLIDSRREWAAVAPIVERIGVKMASPIQRVAELSGGNQQKVSLAKWIARDVEILIVDEPTIGVDVRTKEEIYRILDGLSKRGKAIIVISSDLAEVVRLSDNIVVMSGGAVVGVMPNTHDYDSLSASILSLIVAAEAGELALKVDS